MSTLKMRLRKFLSPNLYAIFYKPCFVPEVTGTTSFDNHLSTTNSLELVAVRYYVRFRVPMPRPKFGLLARGFTAFHSLCFQKDSVTVALSSLLWPIQRLSHFNCRNDFSSLGLWFCLVPNTTGITACASMDFPHEREFSSMRLSKIATSQISSYKSELSKICLPNTSFSRRFRRFKISKFVIEVVAVISSGSA